MATGRRTSWRASSPEMLSRRSLQADMAPDLVRTAARIPARAALELHYARVLRRPGMLGGDSPRNVVASLGDIKRWGQLGGSVSIAARRHGDRVGLIDELGALTFAELDERS